MHHPTDRITHTTAVVTPVVEHWLEREIAQYLRTSCNPLRSEEVERFGEDVVIYETGVHREQAHQQNDVSASEESFENLKHTDMKDYIKS